MFNWSFREYLEHFFADDVYVWNHGRTQDQFSGEEVEPLTPSSDMALCETGHMFKYTVCL